MHERDLPEYITPTHAMLAFEAGRAAALDGVLRTWPGFNLPALEAEDPEVYWPRPLGGYGR